jgi:arsenate reductase
MKDKTTIYYNPRCSKCREALCLLEDNNEEVEIIEYLKDVPSEMELTELIKKLNIKPEQLVRKNEPLFKEEYKNKKLTDAQWIKVLHQHPILIERPIAIKNGKAIIGRPPQLIIDIL